MIEETNSLVYSSEINKEQLVQLIESDPMIRQAICKLMTQVFACDSPKDNNKAENIRVDDDALASKNKKEPSIAALLLSLVQEEPDILASWLNLEDTRELAEARVIACSADFERVLNLWDDMGKKCKQSESQVNNDQHQLLITVISIYNLTLSDRQAETVDVEIGTDFDFEIHKDIGSSGKKIIEQLMPGLKNPAGKLMRKPLVKVR